MKISYNWLSDFIDLDCTPETLSEVLTETGLEVEGLETVEKIKGGLNGLVVGKIVTCEQHPNADKLSKTTVDIGGDSLLNIVCGAPNVAAEQKVIVAPVNTIIYPTEGEPFKIKKAKIRGELSEGMICAEDEIGLGGSHDGIMILDSSTQIGIPAIDLFDTGIDHIFEIGLTPNRGDGASHLGAARDVRAHFNTELKDLNIDTPRIGNDRPISVQVEDTNACPRYSGITIRGIKVVPSPDWLQWRLRAIGLEPINNIVDITNYVLHGLGQPLHAFDADTVGDQVIVKSLPEGTEFTTLDEKERKLSADDLMICNTKGGMCIAGVFGGIDSGIKDSTTSIFLESAYFSADHTRATAMRHSLSTDASFRYERGTDPEITVTALKYATQLILEIAGGSVASEIVDIYPSKVEPLAIPTKFSTFDKLIGKAIPHDKIIQILNALDIETREIEDNNFTAVVPAYRSEVTRPADLVEEVLRIYGINNIDIDDSFSTGYLAEFNEIEPYKLQEEVSHFLAGMGFHEMLTNSLTNEQYEEHLKLADGDLVHILNPSSEDLGIMKPTPLYTSLESIRFNINRKQTNLKFFEFAKTYTKGDKGYKEQFKLCLFLTGKSSDETWLTDPTQTSIHQLTGNIEGVLDKCGIGNVSFTPVSNKSIQYGLSVSTNNAEIGWFGKLNREITNFYSIDQDVFYCEFNWDKIVKKASREVQYVPISKYPEVRRDLSLVLDKSISYDSIQQIAFNSEKKLLTRMNVFSVFEGEQIGEGKKAYAIAFYLQDHEKTLKDKQIDASMKRLMDKFEKELNAVIRK
ncbi:MAG: phenylalanine--tRNA ligase subunit beta [Cyclobacteriaceae bacterium]